MQTENNYGEKQSAMKLKAYAALTRFDSPIGIYLLLWPTLWALWIAAEGFPDPSVLFIFVAGTVLTRSAGCVINDWADRDIDGHVARTSSRPLATGEVTPKEALILAAILMLVAFVLVLFTNRQTIMLSVGALVLAIIYPFSKRFTHLPQVFLGAAFAWAVPMAFTAQIGELNKTAWLIFTAALLWAVAYDTIYAMADREDDLKIGVKSSAILFGDADLTIISVIQGMVILSMGLVGVGSNMGMTYYLGLVVAIALFCYQLWICRNRKPEDCIRAFKNNNFVGMSIFIAIVINYL